MNAPVKFDTPAKPASLAERILAGDLTGLSEHYSDEEWRREAQAALDGDDRDLRWMLADCERRDAFARWQLSARNEREAMHRGGISFEESSFAPSAFEDMLPDMSARHPTMMEVI